MTEEDTYRKLVRSAFNVIDETLLADYLVDEDSVWYYDYITEGKGNSESILEKHHWTREEFLSAKWPRHDDGQQYINVYNY